MNEKIYIGTGKKNSQYDIINGSICLTDIPKEWITTSEKNGKKYLNITIASKKEPDQWGKTHYIAVNTYRPESK